MNKVEKSEKDALLTNLKELHPRWSGHLMDIPESYFTSERLTNIRHVIEELQQNTAKVHSKPFMLTVEPTNKCNLACQACPTKYRVQDAVPRGSMTKDNFVRTINLFKRHIIFLSLQNWGEPLLHKDLPYFLRVANENKIFWYLTTNASIKLSDSVIESILDVPGGKVVFDIDGLTQASYEMYRVKGDLSLVLSNIARFVRMKREKGSQVILEGRMIVSKVNEHESKVFEDFCADLGLDRSSLSKMQVNIRETADLLPDDGKHVYQNYISHEAAPKSCDRLYTDAVVNWDGRVSACCLTYDASSDFGSISDVEAGIEDLWNNENFISARASFVDGAAHPRTICHICQGNLGRSNSELRYFKDTFAITLRKF